MEDKLAEAIATRQFQMQQVRRPYEELIQASVDYVNPRRYDIQGSAAKGQQRLTKQYDGTAQDAFLSWVDGILGWYVSRSLVWFNAYIPDRTWKTNDRVIKYCQEYTEQMVYELRQGNFYSRLPEFLRDGAGSGTACMLTEEARDRRRANHKVIHPGKVYVLEDDEGHVGVVHLKFTLTAVQAVQKYKDDRLDQVVRDCANDPARGTTEFQFVHAIFPSTDPALSGHRITTKPWASVHVLLDSKSSALGVRAGTLTHASTVRKGGYSYNPASIWRFRKNSDEIYGYSPAMDVMSAIMASQQIGRSLLHMGNKAADPPTLIPEEMRATATLLPKGRNYYNDPQRLVVPIPTGGEYPIAKDREDEIHQLIRNRYGYPFWHAMTLLAQKSERVPATQVMELRADQAMMLVGQVDNLGDDGLSPIWDNVAHVAMKGGRLPAAPPELDSLRGKNALRCKFIGPLAQYQDIMFKTNGLNHALQTLAGLAQMLGPQVFDGVKDIETTEFLWEGVNAPRDLLRSADEVYGIRAARQQQMEAQQAAETSKTMAEGISKLAKGAEPNSPLEKMAS